MRKGRAEKLFNMFVCFFNPPYNSHFNASFSAGNKISFMLPFCLSSHTKQQKSKEDALHL